MTRVSMPSFQESTARWATISGIFRTARSGMQQPSANATEADMRDAMGPRYRSRMAGLSSRAALEDGVASRG